MTPYSLPASRRLQVLSLARRLDQLLPLLGVLALFIIWWLISVSGWVNPVLLPTPVTTIATLFQAMFSGTMADECNPLSNLIFHLCQNLLTQRVYLHQHRVKLQFANLCSRQGQ